MKPALLPFLLFAFAGCVRPPDAFDPRGYFNKEYGYRVLGNFPTLVGSDWLIDNFYDAQGHWREKDGEPYRIHYEFDTDGDGSIDIKRELPLFDLRFKHRRHDASIWLRATPFATEWRERELKVLAQAYVDEVAGGGYEAARIEHDRVQIAERRFAAQVIERAPARVAGLDAYDATIDVANLDQIRLTPTERKTRVRLVFVKLPTGFQTYRNGVPAVAFPVVLIVGYANSPSEFASEVKDFESVLGRIEIGGHSGYDRLAPEIASAAPAIPADAPTSESAQPPAASATRPNATP